jgi:hypothetical protein
VRPSGFACLSPRLSFAADSNFPLPCFLSWTDQGTSYTIANTQHITNTSAASNYGQDVAAAAPGAPPPPPPPPLRILPGVDSSPFALKPERVLPSLVLTKAHCAGYCDDCRDLVVSLDEFVAGCSETRADRRAEPRGYDPGLVVAKAVHLFRDPLDNLVSRKHLGVRARQGRDGAGTDAAANNSSSIEWGSGTVVASDTPEGLLAWCRYLDESVIGLAAGWSSFPADFREAFRSVPCASDLFRYVQWHNRAIEAARRLRLPVHYVHYEDYSGAYEETVRGLLDFLELDMTGAGFARALPFDGRNKSYHDLFRHGGFSMTATAAYLRRLATNETWQHLRRYVDGWYDEAKQADADSRVNK